MADAGAKLWIAQADSDWWRLGEYSMRRSLAPIARRFQVSADGEKSIKAIAAGFGIDFSSSVPMGTNMTSSVSHQRWSGCQARDPTDIQIILTAC